MALGWSVLGACSSEDEPKTVTTTGGAGGQAANGGVFGQSGAAGAGAASGASGSSSGGSSSGGTSSGGTSAGGASGAGGSGAATACKGLPLSLDAGTAPADSGADSSPAGSGGTNAVCTGASQEVERIDVDLLFLMDSSVSMGERVAGGQTRWEALRAAMQQLAQAPEAAGLQAGIAFYSISGAGNDNVDCNASAYATPPVPIGRLGDIGPNIVAAINAKSPGGLTPILPAMQGAITYAKQWAQAHPDRAAAIVLVTDSYPTQCSNDPTEVANTAQAAFAGTPSIRTFVIGVGANTGARFNLENFARSGGTQNPFLVDDGNITQTFVDTVLNIASSNLACDFIIPPPPAGQQLSPDRVQVIYTPANGMPEEIPKLNGSGDCARAVNGGYYFDNPTRPTKIYVCGCTCARFGAGRVDVRFGCRPQIG